MTIPDVPIALPFELFVDGPPAPKGSVGRNANNRGVRHSVNSKRWQATITEVIRRHLAHGGRDTDGNVVLLAPVTFAVHVAAEFRIRQPTGNVDPEPTGRRYGDEDKLERCLGDALEAGGLLVDDAQITRWDTHKRWADPAERDGVQLRVTRAPAGYRHPAFVLPVAMTYRWPDGEIPGFRGIPLPIDGTACVADGDVILRNIHDAYEKIKTRDLLREYVRDARIAADVVDWNSLIRMIGACNESGTDGRQ